MVEDKRTKSSVCACVCMRVCVWGWWCWRTLYIRASQVVEINTMNKTLN